MEAQSRPNTAKQSSGLEQFQEGSDLDQPNLQSHSQSKHYMPPHGSFPFKSNGPGPQFNAVGGHQNNNSGNGNQFIYPIFEGPVHFSKSFHAPAFLNTITY